MTTMKLQNIAFPITFRNGAFMTIERLKLMLATVLLLYATSGWSAMPALEALKTASSAYGPLTFNRSGSDFYFSQDGKYVRVELNEEGGIDVYLKNGPFQIGYNGRQLNMALAQIPISEMSADPHGYKASRLSGAMSGARETDSDELLIFGGKLWTDGNVELSDDTSKQTVPMPGFEHGYQINKLIFVGNKELNLSNVKGPIYGYILVYKQAERMNRDIMPIRLFFQ